MTTMSRRQFFKQTATDATLASLLASARATALMANPLGLPIGSQVYPHRALLKDFAAYVKTMAEIGVERLELCSPIGYGADFAALTNGGEVKKILADHGIKAESGHFGLAELRKNQDKS